MREECDYCLKHVWNDGKCNGKYGSQPCLLFEQDPRGCRKYVDNTPFRIDFDTDIPEIGKPNENWLLSGVDKTITFTRFRRIEWNKDAKGLHGIRVWADYWYWSDENGELPPEKPRLKLIKK